MSTQHNLSSPRSVVIIIDDDPAVRNSLKFSLEIEGFAVLVYASGSELLSQHAIPACNCLVIDQKMPDMTGLDLISTLRAQHCSAPAILITSQPNGAMIRRAAGANVPIVEKPLLGNSLMDRIRDACASNSTPTA